VSGASYKSFDEALADALRDITARFDDPRVDVDSNFYKLFSACVAQRMGATGFANRLHKVTRPDLAEGEDLDDAAEARGITRIPALGASNLIVDITVTDTGSWDETLLMTTDEGTEFIVEAPGEWTAGGTVTTKIKAQGTGVITNLPDATELTIENPPQNMESTATVNLDGTDPTYRGRDAETDRDLQRRLANKMCDFPTSGNAAAWKVFLEGNKSADWVMERRMLPIQEVFVYPRALSPYHVGIVPVLQWDGVNRVPNGSYWETPAELSVFVDDWKPTWAIFDDIQLTKQTETFRVTLDTDAEYGRDWGTSATSNISADNSGDHTDSRVYLVAAPSSQNLAVGNRVLCFVGDAFYPNVRTVTAVDNTDDWAEVSEPFRDESGNKVLFTDLRNLYTAGPLTQATVDKVLEMYSRLTPGDTGTPSALLEGEEDISESLRWPPVSQTHPTDITEEMIYRAVLDASDHIWGVTINDGTATCANAVIVAGVLKVSIISPPTSGGDGWLRIEFNTLNT
jgi:hypothetical protein